MRPESGLPCRCCRPPRYLQPTLLCITWVLIFSLLAPMASSRAAGAERNTAGGQERPSKNAWVVGQKLADTTADRFEKKGTYPKRICALVWGQDSAGREGPMVSFVLALLGTRPRWDGQGNVAGLELIPLSELGRPRLDAMVVTTGQFRDLFRDEIILMDQAFRTALAASYNSIAASYPDLRPALETAVAPLADSGALVEGSDPLKQNCIASSWVQAAREYMAVGKSAGEAGELAITRIFAPAVGSYGCGIDLESPMPENSKLVEQFINRVGYSYSEMEWGRKAADLLENLLVGSDTLFYCRTNSSDVILDRDGSPLEYTYLTALSTSLENLGSSTPQLLLGGWSGGKEQDFEWDGGLPLTSGTGQGSGAGQGAEAGPGVSPPRAAPAKPQPPKAGMQYLADKGDTGAAAAGSDAASERQGSQSMRLFEISADTVPLKPGQNRLDVYLTVIFPAMFLFGAGRRYKEYAREVTR